MHARREDHRLLRHECEPRAHVRGIGSAGDRRRRSRSRPAADRRSAAAAGTRWSCPRPTDRPAPPSRRRRRRARSLPARRRRAATDSGTSPRRSATVPRAGTGSATGCSGARIAGSIARSSNRRSVAPAARCRSPTTSLIVPAAPGDDHRVEHERRQLARGDAAGDDVVAADPQDDADRAEHQQDHRRDQERALPDALQRGAERALRRARRTGAGPRPRGRTPAPCGSRAAPRRRRRRRRRRGPGSRARACARGGRRR